MFINFLGNIFYARKHNTIVSLYIVNVTLLLTSYIHLYKLHLKICNSSENVSTRMLWKIHLVLFFLLRSGCGREMQCINGVGSNPVEGRTKIWQLYNLILTLFGLIFRLIAFDQYALYVSNVHNQSLYICHMCNTIDRKLQFLRF
jgi:hypothetical protein